jgi:cation:H+ antiporter
MLFWIAFIVCTLVIVYAGIKLSEYGDIIAEKTGLGRTWIGVVLMASVTSLPELVTGISAVTYANIPDIAVGDVLGSCVFNMVIISFLDAVHRPTPISSRTHHGHVLSAGFGILHLSIAAISLFLATAFYL